MGVDLRRCYVGMPEHLLHAPEIGPVVEQVAGERMPQHMRRQLRRVEPGGKSKFFHQLRAALPGQMASCAARRKQPAPCLAARSLRQECGTGFEIIGERLARGLAQRRQSLLAAFAAHQQKTRIALRRGQGQAHQFRNTQTRRIQDFEEAPQPCALLPWPGGRGGDQPPDFLLGQYLGERSPQSRRIELRRRIILAGALADPEFRSDVIERIAALHRIGEPMEVAGAIVFLASSAASLITGETILIDGGWTAR